ncbi:DUF2207 domain-containing protein [Arcanobacterium haemolyticum]|nr:DUF2207 domain-containing protein [Arcanobacterium haemolyticum]
MSTRPRFGRYWRRFVAAPILAVMAAIVALAAPVGPVRADSATTVGSYDVVARVTDDGALTMRITVDARFSDRVHGPYFVFPTAAEYGDDEYQIFDVKLGEVTQDGSPAKVHTENERDRLIVRVGDEDNEITGSHRYSIDLSVQGLVSSDDESDRLAWDVITAGAYTDWDIESFSLSLVVPEGGEFSCVAGAEGSGQPCAVVGADVAHGEATWSAEYEGLGSNGVTVDASWPSGKVTVPAPLVEKRPGTGITWAAAGAGIGAGLLTGFFCFIIRRKDERYIGGEFGARPLGTTQIGHVGRVRPQIRRAEPDMHPAQAGIAYYGSVFEGDVLTSIVVSLAQRGYLAVIAYDDPVGEKYESDDPTNWLLIPLEKPDNRLEEFEADFLKAIARPQAYEDHEDGGYEPLDAEVLAGVPDIDELIDTYGADVLARGSRLRNLETSFVDAIVRSATQEKKDLWFAPPARNLAGRIMHYAGWIAAVIGLLLVVYGFIEGRTGGIGMLVGVPGIVAILGTLRRTARTAEGTLAREQVEGYRRYILSLKEAQGKEEDDRERLRMLPWAITLRLVGAWAQGMETRKGQNGENTAEDDGGWWYSDTGHFNAASAALIISSMTTGAQSAWNGEGIETAFGGGSSSAATTTVGGGSFGAGGGTW